MYNVTRISTSTTITIIGVIKVSNSDDGSFDIAYIIRPTMNPTIAGAEINFRNSICFVFDVANVQLFLK